MLYNKKKWLAIIFAAPFIIFAIVFLLFPFFSNFRNMFYDFEYKNDLNPVFVGFANFGNLFKDDYFARSLGNTFLLIAFIIVFQVGIALILALLVNRLKKLQNFYRVTFFIPVVISGTVLGTMFVMFGSEYPTGLFNQILALFGVEHTTWLPNNSWFKSLMFVMLPVIWQYIGFYFVIMLTGLTNVPDDIIEAADLDGANGLQTTFYIELPMLWNVLRTAMVLAITGALKVFDLPQVMAPNGSPLGYTLFMGTYNNDLFNQTKIGECAIYSIMIVLIGVIVSQLSNLILRENKDL